MFVIYEENRDKLGSGNAQKLATEGHQGIASSFASVKGGKPGVIFGDGKT